MKKCNQCGAWIDFVTTQAGRHMPVEPRPVVIVPNRGADTFITRDGKMIRGQRALPRMEGFGNIAVYVPHWARCGKGQPRQKSVAQMRAMRERGLA